MMASKMASIVCPECLGTGKTKDASGIEMKCRACNGTGVKSTSEICTK